MAGQIRRKTELRRKRAEFEKAFPKQRHLVFVLVDWDDGYNVGGLFRVAAACGAAELVMVGKTPVPPDPRIGVTSLGFHRRVPWRGNQHWKEAFSEFRVDGFELVAVEVAEGAAHYMSHEYGDKCCLVLGNEGGGLPKSVVSACDSVVAIPMYGKGRSLNVHVAAAIVGFEAMLRGSEGVDP